MIISGYKSFNKGLTNSYGKQFEVGVKYTINGEIKWGLDGNGYHFCTYLEDTLRYFGEFNEEIDICEVQTEDETILYNDEYAGYYDMYVARSLIIVKVLSRKEILNETEKMWFDRLVRFISYFKINEEELQMILQNRLLNGYEVKRLKNIYAYYQLGDKDVFSKSLTKTN